MRFMSFFPERLGSGLGVTSLDGAPVPPLGASTFLTIVRVLFGTAGRK
jgi:hypothetical protein